MNSSPWKIVDMRRLRTYNTVPCRLCKIMPGLCPSVPTELVSVFYLKTGSVQQEQKWSPRTTNTHVPCYLTVSQRSGRKTAESVPNILIAVFNWPHLPESPIGRLTWVMGPDENQTQSVPTCQTTALNREVCARQSSLSLITVPFFSEIWMFHEHAYHFLLDRYALASWATVWILLHTDAVDLVCSAFMFISTFPRQRCKHVSHSLPRSLSLSGFLFTVVLRCQRPDRDWSSLWGNPSEMSAMPV